MRQVRAVAQVAIAFEEFPLRGKQAAWAALCALVVVCAAAQTPASRIRGQVIDEDGKPVDGVEVQLSPATGAPLVVYTDPTGRFEMGAVPPGHATINLSKPGFFQIEKHPLEISEGEGEFTFTLNHETAIQQQVQVTAVGAQIRPETTTRDVELLQHDILNVPVASTHDLTHSLETMPSAVADNSTSLHYAGGRVNETEIVLDGFEIGDPATGKLTTRVNVDSVQSATLQTGDTSAAYAHAGAGVVSLETITGDDHWRVGTTEFIPVPVLNHGLHLGSWYPRFTFSGPIVKKKAWFSEALSLWRVFGVVQGLPAGQDFSTAWYGDSLTRFQVSLTPQNMLSANFIYNHSYQADVGLGVLTPYSTTTSVDARRWFASLRDQIWFGHTVLEFGVAGDSGIADTLPQGSGAYIVSPSAVMGNYFQSLEQRGRRLQLVGDVTSTDHHWHGKHTFSVGGNFAGLDSSQAAFRDPIDYIRADLTLSEVATFSGQSAFRLSDTQAGGYAQDSWQVAKPIEVALALRGDWDRLVQHGFVGPRVAVNVLPLGEGRAKLTVSWGAFYAPLDLSLLGLGYDQQRTDVFYDSTGTNQLPGTIVTKFLLPSSGLEQPWFSKTSVEWEQRVSENTYFGASFLLRKESHGLAYENASGVQTMFSPLGENNRRDRYVAGEFWVRRRFGKQSEISLDYIRSRASSNQAVDFSLASLIFTQQLPGPLPWDVPNRFLSTGWTPVPFWHLFFSYFAEYRTGLPFNIINEQQQLIGMPDGARYPAYFNLNLGIEKQFRFRRKEYAIRFSILNVTGHENPNQVVNNLNAPNFLTFAGGPGRAFTARLRFVGSK
ncbi:MAG: carboxypeptidase regulatory-like domain-containing protein [Candidatus Acidiferrales bacterium]